VLIRTRGEADQAQIDAMARDVQLHDGYPPWLGQDDLLAFIVSPDALEAWVAVADGRVAGHAALHATSSDPVMELASTALDRPAAQLGVVARLLVDREARGQGIGRSLLATAASAAAARGLWPVLDVVITFKSAIELYESAGWTRLGQVTFRLPDGTDLDELVFAAPSGPSRSS
jgi:GNAT superfamily N-acetyltransferase